MFAKTKPHRYLVGVVVDGTNDVATLIGSTRAGAAAAGTNIIISRLKSIISVFSVLGIIPDSLGDADAAQATAGAAPTGTSEGQTSLEHS